MAQDEQQLQSYVGFAAELAREGGRLARQHLGTAQLSHKADRTVVTDIDHAVQERITTAIAARFPKHAVLAEETLADPQAHAEPSRADYCWVIDPIDGTRNFARNLPCFCTSIALLHHAVPVVGVIYEPSLDRLYQATAGGGVWLGADRLSVSQRDRMTGIMIAVPSSHRRETPPEVRAWLDRVNVRNTGSAALHLAYLAAGYIDAAYALDCYIWDIAAGWLMVREGGGRMTTLTSGELFPADLATVPGKDMPFVAATPGLHPVLSEIIGHFAP